MPKRPSYLYSKGKQFWRTFPLLYLVSKAFVSPEIQCTWCTSGLELEAAGLGQLKEEQRQLHAALALCGHHSCGRLKGWRDLIYRLHSKLHLVGQSLVLTLLFPKFDLTYVISSLWWIIQKQPMHNFGFGQYHFTSEGPMLKRLTFASFLICERTVFLKYLYYMQSAYE